MTRRRGGWWQTVRLGVGGQRPFEIVGRDRTSGETTLTTAKEEHPGAQERRKVYVEWTTQSEIRGVDDAK